MQKNSRPYNEFQIDGHYCFWNLKTSFLVVYATTFYLSQHITLAGSFNPKTQKLGHPRVRALIVMTRQRSWGVTGPLSRDLV